MARVKIVQPRISFADLERAPEDGHRYELYDGEVFVVPAPLPRHQVVQHLIAEMLRDYATNRGGFAVPSPIDIVFSDYDVLQPDVVFFTADRRHLVDLDRVIRHPPDLCVEVISPSTQATDRGRKMQMFARFGVPEYWIVDPRARRIEVYRLDRVSYTLLADLSGAGVIESPTLAGLAFSLADLFPSE
jgi:Uma2 family endonuclease